MMGFSRSKSLGMSFSGSTAVGTLLCVLGIWSNMALGYNVDIESPLVQSGETGSMFGYAVSQHTDQQTKWLLVGAPKGITSQRGVNRAGSVFRCRIDQKDYCQEIPFDSTGNDMHWDGSKFIEIEDKSDQWFGATVSSGKNGVIVACAPRYTYFSSTFDKREPVGTCYLAKARSTTYEEFSPCRTAVDKRPRFRDQFDRHGYCQVGLAASMSNNGEQLMISAVGSYYWQGQLYNYKVSDPSVVQKTAEGPPTDDDSYMGYSSSVGDFDGDDIDDYIVGIPKAEQHLGKVAMYTQNFTNIANITGEQVGSYFGYALAVTDLDGDELDDVIVSAPFYSDYTSSSVYDTGRVYIYYQQTTNKKFKKNRKDILDGVDSRSRFGSAVSKLGDINSDGYKDLGVGAPYAGKDGKGAVYIYHGSIKGIITQVSQVIYAEDIRTGLSTFGHALSGGLDQDDNSYPDLLVGAYGSDKAVFLRTRPVVRMTVSLKIEPEMINLEKKSCSLVNDVRVSCLSIHTCLEYTGTGVPEELYFNIEWNLDTLQRNKTVEEPRAFYLLPGEITKENNTIKLTKKTMWCYSSFAYVKNEPRDKLTPIAVDFNFDLHDQVKRDKRELKPVLDQYIPKQAKQQAQILKHCGKDNICIPDLVVNSFRVSAEHIIGSKAELEILIMVQNRGENAFNSKLWITLPQGVSYRNIHAIQAVIKVSCSADVIFEEVWVTCDLGNPLPFNATANFTLKVSPTKKVNGSVEQLIFALNINSSNSENFSTTANNVASVSIPVTAAADLQLYGKSTPELIIFNATEAKKYARENKRPTIEHLYELRNLGPSATKTTELTIFWPERNAEGGILLPMERAPEIVKGNGKCATFFVTPNNFSSFHYDDRETNRGVDVVLRESLSRRKREDQIKEVKCTNQWCRIVKCLVQYMEPNDNFLVKIKGKLFTDTLISSGAAETLMLTSRATAEVKSVPYKLKSLNVDLFTKANREVSTAVNPDNLVPKPRPIEIWIIAVSITAGLLVLLLLIILLWWCGFFKRRKPEDDGYMMTNGNHNIDDKQWD